MFFSSSAASLTWSFERRFINPNSLRYSVTNIYSVLIPICVKFDSYVDTYRSRWFCVLVLFASLRVFLMAMFLAPVEDSTDSTGPHWRTTTTTHIFFATYQKLQRNTSTDTSPDEYHKNTCMDSAVGEFLGVYCESSLVTTEKIQWASAETGIE
jgi:hypothetical protein